MHRLPQNSSVKGSTSSVGQVEEPTCRFLFVNNFSVDAKQTEEVLKTFRNNPAISAKPLHLEVDKPSDYDNAPRPGVAKFRYILLQKGLLQLKSTCHWGKIFLVVQATAFVVFVDLLSEEDKDRSIRKALQGIVVLHSSKEVEQEFPSTLVHLKHRFDTKPLTWAQTVKSSKPSPQSLLRDLLNLEQVTQSTKDLASKETTNFQFFLDFELVNGVDSRTGTGVADQDVIDRAVDLVGDRKALNLAEEGKRSATWGHSPRESSFGEISLEMTRSFSLPAESSSASKSLRRQTPDSPGSGGRYRALLQQANVYHGRGQLREAELCYGNILRLRLPWITQLSATTSLAVIDLQKGKHLRAKRALDSFIKNQPPLQTLRYGPLFDLLRDAMFRRATARARLGLYQKVFQDLKFLAKSSDLWELRGSPNDTETGNSLASKHSTSKRKDPGSPVATPLDIGIARLWALSAAYSGFSPSICVKMLETAGSLCQDLEQKLKAQRQDKTSTESLDFDPSQDICGLQIAIQLTAAKIHLVHGDMQNAKKQIDEAWYLACDNLLDFSVLTLEVGLVRAHILTLTHHFTEAKRLCNHIAALTSTYLGDDHPFKMDSEWILILAASFQGRYGESMTMSQSLCSRAISSKCLGPEHPLTLKYQSQQAGILLRMGYYRDAECLLRGLVQEARRLWPSDDGKVRPNPSTLRYLSQLALAECFLGDTESAEVHVLTALRYQPWPLNSLREGSPATLSCWFAWTGAPIDNEGSSGCPHSHEKDWLDPDTMISVLIRGWVEVSKLSPDLDVITEILSIGQSQTTHHPPGLPPASDTRVLWSLALGQVYSSKAMSAEDNSQKKQYSKMAINELRRTIRRQPLYKGEDMSESHAELLPDHHPLLMAARRDLYAIRCYAAPMETEALQAVKQNLKAILKAQEINPGWAHPETLQTMMCLLANEVAIDRARRGETVAILEDLHLRLNSKMMKRQCPVQRYHLLESVSGLLAHLDSFVKEANDFSAEVKAFKASREEEFIMGSLF